MGKFLVVYFDDIHIYSISHKQHLDHLHQVCSVLRKEEFVHQPKEVLSTQVQFLRFVVSIDRVSADPKKVRAIEERPSPRSSMM